MQSVKEKVVQYMLGVALAGLLFCYVMWGDFAWVTLVGPITLEPRFAQAEGPQYMASPALKAFITRILFLITCVFFCMIPGLARGLWRNARYMLGGIAIVYTVFSFVLGTGAFFAVHAPEASTLRLLSVLSFFVLLVCGYDTQEARFTVLHPLRQRSFIMPFFSMAMVMIFSATFFFQGMEWLGNENIRFVLLRLGGLLTAFTASLAVYTRQRGA